MSSVFALRFGDSVALLLIALVLGATSIHLGGDGSPDFRIYHFYNGYAAASGGRPQDIAAAQLQTYFFPGMDVLYYWLTTWLNEMPRTLRAVLAIPYVIAATCVYVLARAVLPQDWPWRRLISIAVALFGVCGAASLPTLGTSMSDITPGMFVLLGLCSFLYFDPSRKDAAVLLSGLFCGVAVGLKLTSAPLFIGFAVAIAVSRWLAGDRWFRGILLFCMIGGLTIVAIGGAWWWRNYTLYGNPLFPAFNDIFKSDLVEWGRWSDDRFKPRNGLMALFYPFYWAFVPSGLAIELATRDARMALAYICVPVIAAVGLFRRSRKANSRLDLIFYIFLPIFYAVSFVLWERLLSIYRYLAVLESLSGLLLLLALLPAVKALKRHGLNVLLLLIMCLVSITAVYPWWSRSSPAKEAVAIGPLPSLPPASTVVFLDAYAMSYLVPFFPADTRFIGANNNIVHPGDRGMLQRRVETAIRSAPGTIWGLEFPPAFPGMADATLLHYGLTRVQPCSQLRSNIEDGILLMCELRPKALSP